MRVASSTDIYGFKVLKFDWQTISWGAMNQALLQLARYRVDHALPKVLTESLVFTVPYCRSAVKIARKQNSARFIDPDHN